MNIYKNRGIKLFTDLTIDLNITGFAPKEKLCLLVGHLDDEINWNYTVNDCFEKLDVLAVVNGYSVFAPMSGRIDKIYSSDFKGKKCVFCSINVNEEQPPLYPVLDNESEPKDIFELKKIALDAVIIDDYKKQLFYDTLITTKKYKKIILNCCDDQPYVLSKTAQLMNYSDEIINGLSILKNALEINNQEIVVFKNFIINKFLKNNVIDVKTTKTKHQYPIYSYFNKREHLENALIVTPEICRNIYRASVFKEPTTTKIITAWGEGLSSPKILEVPLGTLVNDILTFCDSEKGFNKVIASGLISGYLTAPYLPITRYDDSITVITQTDDFKLNDCINCGKCLEVCPIGLAPSYILQKPVKKSEIKFFNTFNYCIECGCCSYVCPANIPLKSYIKAYNAQSKKVQDE